MAKHSLGCKKRKWFLLIFCVYLFVKHSLRPLHHPPPPLSYVFCLPQLISRWNHQTIHHSCFLYRRVCTNVCVMIFFFFPAHPYRQPSLTNHPTHPQFKWAICITPPKTFVKFVLLCLFFFLPFPVWLSFPTRRKLLPRCDFWRFVFSFVLERKPEQTSFNPISNLIW